MAHDGQDMGAATPVLLDDLLALERGERRRADDLAAVVEDRAAAVARVDRRVGLDQVGQPLVLHGDRPAGRRDDPAGDRKDCLVHDNNRTSGLDNL